MKKISLKNLNIQEVEQLSREQLKDVLGGSWGGSTGTGTTNWWDTETGSLGECITECKCTRDGVEYTVPNSACMPCSQKCG